MARYSWFSGQGYRSTENFIVTKASWCPQNGTRRGIIHAHGVSETVFAARPDSTNGNIDKIRALAAAGYIVVSADLSSSTYAGANWGNDDHIASIDALWTYMKSNLGVKTDKVGLYGASMGNVGMLAWARQHLSSVFAAVGVIPVTDVDNIYQNDLGGLRAGIGTAYGVTYPTSLGSLATHSPRAFGSSDLLGLPLLQLYSGDDSIAENGFSIASWDGRGATITKTNFGAYGHAAAQAPPQTVVQFMDDNGGKA